MDEQAITREIIKHIDAIVKGGTPVEATTALLTLSEIDSLTIVQLLEQVEQQFAIEIDPALIVPETFATPQALAQAVIASLAAGSYSVSK